MHPNLIDFGPTTLPWIGEVHLALPSYGLFMAIALVVCWFWFLHNIRRIGLDVDAASTIAFWTFLAGLAGGKLGLILVEYDVYILHPKNIFTTNLLQAAGVVWVGLLVGTLCFVGLTRRAGLPLGRTLDAGVITLPVAQAIGRVGCLMAGCCYGAECSLPWAIRYPESVADITRAPVGIDVHPSPVYEILWNMLVVLPLLFWVRKKRMTPGMLLPAYLASYGIGRFAIEFTRGDSERGLWFGGALSTSQIISAVMVVAAGAIFFKFRHRESTEAETTDPSSRRDSPHGDG